MRVLKKDWIHSSFICKCKFFNIHYDKNHNKVSIEGMYLNTIKAIYDKLTANIYLVKPCLHIIAQ